MNGQVLDVDGTPVRVTHLDKVLYPATGTTKAAVIDYVVHYVKASGATSAKVFKWTEARVQPGQPLVLTKRQTIRDFTTRTHYAGRHEIELIVNGGVVARAFFDLAR